MRRHSSFKAFPILETKRLILREIIPEDAQIVFEIFSDPDVTRYYDVDTFSEKKQSEKLIRWCANRFKYKDGIRWGIVERKSNILIGTCGFHNWRKTHRKAEMGYELSPLHWGQGYTTEAISKIVKFGFDHLEFNRIEAWSMLENTASMIVLKKTGFQEEGILRDYGYWHGCFHDVMMFSLLRKDWDDRRK